MYNPNKKFNGLHFSDIWKDYISGHNEREKATKDGTKLFNEVYHYRDDLFPVRSVPASKPGYVTHNQDFFRITTKGVKTRQLLTRYFFEEHGYRKDESIGYSGAHDLAGFFEFILQGLLVDGISYYAVEWGEVKLDSKSFILPRDLMYVNPATVKVINSPEKYATQKFSWVAKLVEDYFEYQDHIFQKDELLVFKHPTLFPSSPVGMAVKSLKKLNEGMDVSLWQSKANAEPTNHMLKVERSRYMDISNYWRKQSVTRVGIKRLFNQPVGDQNVGITTYYEVYAYAEYKKTLNLMRSYLAEEFNKQLLSELQIKNNIKTPITLEFRGFASNDQIDKAFEAYAKGEVDVKGFADAVKDDYDKALF